eukprot:Nitzschia sp. Nitz4//scaffold4_size323378//317749//319957//NITZ4_000718-RA/size323378-augustus-gene-0.62-mRNA-1//-1//CDS//3329553573//9175//frame0
MHTTNHYGMWPLRRGLLFVPPRSKGSVTSSTQQHYNSRNPAIVTTMGMDKSPDFQHACSIWFCPKHERTAAELRDLPQEQREKVWADLSGNEDTSIYQRNSVEDPKQLEEALENFRNHIATQQNNASLELALRKLPDYVMDRGFLLSFLRSCEFDWKEAVKKLNDFMDMKRLLFGEDSLCRDMELRDLRKEDMDVLVEGGFQFLKDSDVAGRRVLYVQMTGIKGSFTAKENLARALFYCVMAELEDENVQKQGVVMLWDLMMEYTGGYDYEAHRLMLKVWTALPYRVVARYIMFQSDLWKQVLDVIHHFVHSSLRARTRWIQGSSAEVTYALGKHSENTVESSFRMADPEQDFGGYMEALAAAEEYAAEQQQMYDSHEHWRQNTWGGFATRQVQALVNHFKPFFMSVADSMRDDENAGKRLVFFIVRLMVLFCGFLFLHALGRLAGYVIGGDIVKEEEVVIIHEYETEEEAKAAKLAAEKEERQKKDE